MSVRLLLISSYVANWMDPFETPTSASRDPLYSPLVPSARYIVRRPSGESVTGYSTDRNDDEPHRPRNAVGSFLAVANTLVLTTHIGFVNIAVIAPKSQPKLSIKIQLGSDSLASAAASRC